MKPQGNFGLHISQFFLNKLRGRQWLAKLFAVHRIAARTVPAVFGCTHHAPGNAKARFVQTPKRTTQSLGVWQQCFFTNFHIVQNNFTCDRSTQRNLAINHRRGEALQPTINNEATNFTIKLCPHDCYMRNR